MENLEKYLNNLVNVSIDHKIFDRAFFIIDSVFDASYWLLTEFNIDLFDNQIEIFCETIDLNVKYLSIIGARSSGKTFAVASGLVKLCITNPKLQVGVFAPKAAQANRIIDEITHKVFNSETKKKYLIENKVTKSFIEFKNGSQILAQSAAPEVLGEGWHFDVLVCDESHSISSISFSQRLTPMLRSSSIAKIIQLGIPKYKNHFWKSFHNPYYKKIIHPWYLADKLFQGGALLIDNKYYPRGIIEEMPYSLKQQYFPNHPELWFESTTNMSLEDFLTQYEMKWLDDISLVLNEEDQIKLASGEFKILETGIAGESYYFGLDFAGGKMIGDKEKSDFTCLSIFRKQPNQVKEKVFAREWKGDLVDQAEDIINLIHPNNGLFRCKFGIADYGNMGAGIIDIMIKMGIPVFPIYFHQKEPITGKNYKNAMMEHFLFELRNNRVLYPNIVHPNNPNRQESSSLHKLFKKHFDEWCSIEKRKGIGINCNYSAPDDLHDDGVFADIMATFAADEKITKENSNYRIPTGIRVQSLFSSSNLGKNFISTNNYTNRMKKFLGL